MANNTQSPEPKNRTIGCLPEAAVVLWATGGLQVLSTFMLIELAHFVCKCACGYMLVCVTINIYHLFKKQRPNQLYTVHQN